MIVPRIIRASQIPEYLGVNKQYFNENIRPHLTEVKLGPQMICFDRVELDSFVDSMFEKVRKAKQKKEPKPCKAESQDLPKKMEDGGSTNKSKVNDFEKVRAQLISKKRSGT